MFVCLNKIGNNRAFVQKAALQRRVVRAIVTALKRKYHTSIQLLSDLGFYNTKSYCDKQDIMT